MATIITLKDEQAVIRELGTFLKNNAYTRGSHFKIGVSGGSVIKSLTQALMLHPDIDFTRWVIFFCDERVVPEDDPESTFGLYKKTFEGKLPFLENQFIRIKQGVSADEAAEDYVRQMEVYFKPEELPTFDLLLLGMGPDGHTCSLFPGHPLLEETTKWVAPITDSPKPPPCRITLTLPVINNAKLIIFSMTGDGKADMVKRILKDKELLPAGMVQPKHGKLYWLLDVCAAKHL